MTPLPEVRLALGLRSTAQSLGVIGRDAGVFREQGLDLVIAREETAGPDGVRGLVAGEYDLAEFGAVPLVQAVYEGHDPVVLLAAEQTNAMYLLGAARIDAPRALVGEKIGVLSIAGQTGVSAATMLDRWTLRREDVELLELGTYPAIYQALQDGRIAAGVLTADYGVAGSVAFGLHRLADLGQELRFQGPIVATTRRYARASGPRPTCRDRLRAHHRAVRGPPRPRPGEHETPSGLPGPRAGAGRPRLLFPALPAPAPSVGSRPAAGHRPVCRDQLPPALRLEDVWDRSFLDRSLQA